VTASRLVQTSNGRFHWVYDQQSNGAMSKRKGGSKGTGDNSASREIEASIEALDDWRGKTLARVRKLIHAADPDVVEEVKWRKPSNAMRGVPVWSHDGILCTGETYKTAVKLTFAKGASLPDPARLFNSGLDGNVRRAIDIHEGDKLDEQALKALVRAAVSLNTGELDAPVQTTARPTRGPKKPKRA
jgi:hypothetical protein